MRGVDPQIQDRQAEARGWVIVLPVGLVAIASVFAWAGGFIG